MEKKREVLGDLERENHDFVHKFQTKAMEKSSLRNQISDIEHLIRQLKYEIESTNVDTKKVQIMAEKEDELLARKAVEDKRLVKLAADDLRDHIRSLEEQVSLT